ncbi:hypothetical protein H2200_007998 [Cladophialophora chaetospira]|uniref:Uncharacterized protein n=1 Tax=Cladophialophora chaetospira TaxID=386627 RepID=A0AA39CGY5_9EURO|nr:hypothetical protein H2200_007998 [Cladophialophora chaetospira]
MSDPNGEYTYICTAGSRRSLVLHFNDGTPRHHRRDYKPDSVATVKQPGTDESLYGNKVEGALFNCELRSDRLGGSKIVYWMIDPIWQSKVPKAFERVGWATTVRLGLGPGANSYSMVPIWASERWELGIDSKSREPIKSRYYFQNDYGRGRPSRPSCGFLDVPAQRPRAKSETRYTVVQSSYERDVIDDGVVRFQTSEY